jgi:hypothetical protein
MERCFTFPEVREIVASAPDRMASTPPPRARHVRATAVPASVPPTVGRRGQSDPQDDARR